MNQLKSFKLTAFAVFVLIVLGCSATAPKVDSRGNVKLSGQPAITFHTSGWSYTNTENPFILTPDYLTNAMVGVSRLQPGQPILRNGSPVPEQINESTIRRVFEQKLGFESALVIDTQIIGPRAVVVASYSDEEKYRQEYGFELGGVLLHVVVVANHGHYASEAERVARTVIETMVENGSRR